MFRQKITNRKNLSMEQQLRQFFYESEEWGRLLIFLKQETIAFKSRLAEIADIADANAMVAAEKFQDNFIAQDRMNSFLSDELRAHLRLLEQDLSLDRDLFVKLQRNQKKIRRDINTANMLFAKMRREFSNYLNYLF